MLRYLRLKVAYDGTNYKGFQKQPDVVTVQQVLEKFLSRVCGETIHISGSGRTDTGVHAYGQVISFATHGTIPAAGLLRAGAGLLPPDIVLLEGAEVGEDFHARKSALWKRYLYRIRLREHPSPFCRNYYWQLPPPLNLALLQQGADVLLGTHDFSGFRSSGSAAVDPVKTIYESYWQQEGADHTFVISGNGFVYHMVRNLVWNLVKVGQGRLLVQELQQQLSMTRGQFENAAAPAQGLYLAAVGYEPWASPQPKKNVI